MRNVAIIDSGPLIALFDRADNGHTTSVEFLKRFKGRLVTTWPVITEVVFILRFSRKAVDDFLEWIECGAVELAPLTNADLDYIRNRMEKYADLPMDLADATLMCVAEREGIGRIASLDSDFSIYRTLKGKMLKNLI